MTSDIPNQNKGPRMAEAKAIRGYFLAFSVLIHKNRILGTYCPSDFSIQLTKVLTFSRSSEGMVRSFSHSLW